MQALPLDGPFSCKTLFISDVHLGSVHCKAEQLLDFLNRVDCERLYLVGDIIDVWAMSKRVHWPQSHGQVLRRIQELSTGTTKVIYIPGNHDASFREFCNSDFGNIQIRETDTYVTGAGQRMLVTHGDEFDFAVRYSRLNRIIGDIGYDFLMWVNRRVNQIREWQGKPYWSLAKWIKVNVSRAEAAILAYQHAGVNLALDRGFDGIICGHLHYPNIEQFGDIVYCNDGDWVENCTAIIEDASGQLRLIQGLSHPSRALEVSYAEAA